jgi:hypothetical protein
MPDFASRAAVVGLMLAGLATVLDAWALPGAEVDLAAQYAQLLTVTLGLALLVAAAVRSWRVPVIAAAVLAKLGFVAAWLAVGSDLTGWHPALEAALLPLLGACGAIFLLDARREARWNARPSLRLEL